MSDQPNSPRSESEIVPAESKVAGLDEKIGRAMENAAGAGITRTFAYALAAILAAHPAVGPYAALVGVADVFIGGGAQRMAETRAKLFAESVAREFATVRSEMIRADYFETEGGVDLLMRALASAVRVQDNARRDAVARILVAAASGNVSPAVEPESLIAVLGEMTDNEAVLLGMFWNEYGRTDERWELVDGWETGIEPASFASRGEFLLRRLIALGLLGLRTSLRRFGSSPTSFSGTREEAYFTPTGAALLRYLEVNPPA